jgi:tripartite-type tricarboxylate transporter receptor subunit TctC
LGDCSSFVGFWAISEGIACNASDHRAKYGRAACRPFFLSRGPVAAQLKSPMSSPDRMRLRRLLLKTLPMGAVPVASISSLARAAEPASSGRPISMVLPFPPGGSVDIVARQLQPGLKSGLGQTVVVDNKPGAGGLIASSTVARAKPDGNTLLMAFDTHAINPFAYKNLPYDTFKDFTPISQLVRFPLVIAANPALSASNVRELVELARANPKGVRYASSGIGSLNQLAAEALATDAGVQFLHVPYKGGGPAVQAVLAGKSTCSSAATPPCRPTSPPRRSRCSA